MRASFVCAVLLAAAGPAFAEEPPVTPDQPAYVNKLAQEQVALALASDPGTRLEALAAAVDERVRELRAVLAAKQPQFVAPLANAYMRLVLDGMLPVVQQSEREGLDLTGSLAAAEKRARKHPVMLEELSLQAPPEHDGLFQKASETARKHLAMLRQALDRGRTQRGGSLGQGGDDSEAGASSDTGEEGFGFEIGDLKKPKEGGSGSGGGKSDRREGRGD